MLRAARGICSQQQGHDLRGHQHIQGQNVNKVLYIALGACRKAAGGTDWGSAEEPAAPDSAQPRPTGRKPAK